MRIAYHKRAGATTVVSLTSWDMKPMFIPFPCQPPRRDVDKAPPAPVGCYTYRPEVGQRRAASHTEPMRYGNMTEAVRNFDSDQDDYSEEAELPTAHLTGSNLASENQRHATREPATDWLTLLTSSPNVTEPFEDEEPEAPPVPSGMSAHSSPPRIAPTLWSRTRSTMRRGTLLIALALLALGTLAGGAFALFSTEWISGLVEPNQKEQGSSQTTQPQPEQAAPAPPSADSGPSQAPPRQQEQPPPAAGANDGMDAATLRDMGADQYKAGKFKEAIALLESAISAGAGDAVTYHQLGLAYMSTDGPEQALADAELSFRTAISLQPDWASPHRLLAESLLRRGFFAEAIEPAEEAARLAPNDGEAWLTLGRAYQGAGREGDATRAFAEAARLSPAPPQP